MNPVISPVIPPIRPPVAGTRALRSGGEPPSTGFLDTFTDTDGTQLTSHTPDEGAGSWVNGVAGASGRNAIVANTWCSDDLDANSRCAAHIDYGVSGNRQIEVQVKGELSEFALYLRYVDANNLILVSPLFGNVWRAYERVSGVDTPIGTADIGIAAGAANALLAILVSGDDFSLTANGGAALEFTSTANPSVTGIGLSFLCSAEDGSVGIDSLAVTPQ